MTAQLSANDSRVLSALFDPESSPSGAVHIETNSTVLPGLSQKECDVLAAQEAAILQALDVARPSPSVLQDTHAAVSDLLARNTGYAPAYVDRAQITRMMLDTHMIFTQAQETHSRALLSDLQDAIRLASPAEPQDGVSAVQARVLAAAHTHRGLLLLKAADLRARGEKVFGAGEALNGMDSVEVESLASKDFFLGGRYGNKIAQQLSVKTNPYAKMCGAIVKEAMQKEIEEAEGILRDDLVMSS
ncbi:hypothetical protein ANO11243_004710 [Dothideomycetidae sp. 11243]|nr:hypothetical protein ANO11243_004710 [fungal sp. No.11243]